MDGQGAFNGNLIICILPNSDLCDVLLMNIAKQHTGVILKLQFIGALCDILIYEFTHKCTTCHNSNWIWPTLHTTIPCLRMKRNLRTPAMATSSSAHFPAMLYMTRSWWPLLSNTLDSLPNYHSSVDSATYWYTNSWNNVWHAIMVLELGQHCTPKLLACGWHATCERLPWQPHHLHTSQQWSIWRAIDDHCYWWSLLLTQPKRPTRRTGWT